MLQNWPVWGGSRCVVSADLNQDSLPDLIAVGYSSTEVRVHLGTGAGQFGAASSSIITGVHFFDALTADVDGDSHPDMILNGYPAQATIAIMLGNWIGGLLPPTAFATGGASGLHLAIADLNSDFRPDIAIPLSDLNGVAVLLNETPLFTGILLYGTGTPGCTGQELLSANQVAHINGTGFKLSCTNAPPLAVGLWMIADAADAVGSDPFGIGATLHLDLFNATELIAANATSDASGFAVLPTPIPNNPSLIGKTYYAQTLWAWAINVCFNFPYGISTSNGLAITIQP